DQIVQIAANAVDNLGNTQTSLPTELLGQLQRRVSWGLEREKQVADSAKREDIVVRSGRSKSFACFRCNGDAGRVGQVLVDMQRAGSALGRWQGAVATRCRLPVHNLDPWPFPHRIAHENATRAQGPVVESLLVRVLQSLGYLAQQIQANC